MEERKPLEDAVDNQKKEDVDSGLFTRSSGIDTLTLSKTLSSRKAMKREYVPKTIIQFLRERKSFHENQEQLQKHMKEAHRLLSPAAFMRTSNNVVNCPELILDPEAKLSDSQIQPASSNEPFIIAVGKTQPDCRWCKFRQNLFGQPIHQRVQKDWKDCLHLEGGRFLKHCRRTLQSRSQSRT